MPSPATLTTAAGAVFQILTARLYQFWNGAWIVEVDLDPDASAKPLPPPLSGKVTLSLAGTALQGAIDTKASGVWGPTAKLRIVAGNASWDQTVSPQDFHDDAGVAFATVAGATATLIGEVFQPSAPPLRLGIDFLRSGGAASRIFGDRDWYVDFRGVTQLGPRVQTPNSDTNLLIKSFDPAHGLLEFHADSILTPGTTLSDPRFGASGPVTTRQVEQIFDKSGSHGFAWVDTANETTPGAGRLETMLRNLAKEAAPSEYLRGQRYRAVLYQGTRLALQAVNPQGGLPDIVPLSQWSGLAGAVAHLTSGQEVFVLFDFTTPLAPVPILVSYSLAGLPQTSTVDAEGEVDLGPTAPIVKLAGGGDNLVLSIPYKALLTALTAFASSVASATTLGQIIAAGATLQTALGMPAILVNSTIKTFADGP